MRLLDRLLRRVPDYLLPLIAKVAEARAERDRLEVGQELILDAVTSHEGSKRFKYLLTIQRY